MSVAQTSEEVAAIPAGDQPTEKRGLRNWLWVTEAAALPLLAIVLAIFFAVLPATSEVFPTTANLRITLGAQAGLIVIAMAALVPLICGEYDFSVGATAGLGAVLAASTMSSGGSLVLAIAVALGVGLGIGIVNGLLVTFARVNSVVTTLGTATLIAGLVSWKTDGRTIATGIPDNISDFGSSVILGIPKTCYVALAVTIGVYYLLRQTPYGRYLDAIGSNRVAARLVGLKVNRAVLTSFVVSGLLAGGAGILLIALSGTASPAVGPDFTLPAIAAAFLSVAAIQPGRFNVWGTLIAILFLAILNSGLNLAGASPFVNDFANGGALIIGVALASLLGRRRSGAY